MAATVQLDGWGILALAFGYRSSNVVISAMETYGDGNVANLFANLQEQWLAKGSPPDLTHEVMGNSFILSPTRDEYILVLTQLIEAFDRARETGKRPNLRMALEAIYDLRAFARLTPLNNQAAITTRILPGSRPSRLDTFPLSSSQLKRLRLAGYSTLGDLENDSYHRLIGKTGMTGNQLDRISEIIENFLVVQTESLDAKDLGWVQDFDAIGRETLGDSFRLRSHSFRYFVYAHRQMRGICNAPPRAISRSNPFEESFENPGSVRIRLTWRDYVLAHESLDPSYVSKLLEYILILKQVAKLHESGLSWTDARDKHRSTTKVHCFFQLFKSLVQSPSWAARRIN